MEYEKCTNKLFLGDFSGNMLVLTDLTSYNDFTGTSYHNLLLIS